MDLCLICPRFHPVIGGAEIYLKNIAEYCSKYLNITVITSNIKSSIKLFEKYQFIKKKHDLLFHNVDIIRTKILNNFILRNSFNINEFLNHRLERLYDKKINPGLYGKKKKFIGRIQTLNDSITKKLIFQRLFGNPNFLQLYSTLNKINSIHKIKIIHSAPIYLTANLFSFRFSKKKEIPFICTPLFHIRSSGNYFFSPSFQYLLKNTDAIIACTNIEKKFYERYGIISEKIHIIPPGIDPKSYEKPRVNTFRNKYKISNKAPLLFFLGRRSYNKGIMNSINALKYLIKKFPDILLMIAGPTTHEYELFQNLIPGKLKNHIIDLGFIDEKTKIEAIDSCDIFLLPSLDDAFGIVYLEAWLFKKPVIGALEGNVAGLIDNNVNGILIPFNNIKELSLKIEELLENEKLRNNLGNNGYNELKSRYLLKDTNKQMLDLYKKFI